MHTERVTPIAAAVSAVSTLLCCLPLGFAAAAATASLGVAIAALRPWLLGASFLLIIVGFVQVYRRNACDRRNRTTVAILWISAAVVLLTTLFPQLFAAHPFGGHRTPEGQPPLADLDAASLNQFRADFNAAADETRMILLLSPT